MPKETCSDEKDVHAGLKLRRKVEKVNRSLSTAHQEVESRFKEVESRPRFEEEEFSESPTRAQFEKSNTDPLKPGPQVREDAELTRRKMMSSFLLEVQLEFQRFSPMLEAIQYPRGRNQERKGEMGDNMRCLYTRATMPRSVHCSDDAALHIGMSVQRGEAAVPA